MEKVKVIFFYLSKISWYTFRENEMPTFENLDAYTELKDNNYDMIETSTFYLVADKRNLAKYQLTDSRPYCGTLSFAYKDSTLKKNGFTEKQMPPILLPLDKTKRKTNTKYPETLIGTEMQPSGVLKVTDKEAIENQKGILGDVVKKAAAAIFTGQGIVRMSQPIRIFEPTSTLERIAGMMGGFPKYVTIANNCNNLTETIKYIICGMLAGQTLSTSMRKPFNPYLE